MALAIFLDLLKRSRKFSQFERLELRALI